MEREPGGLQSLGSQRVGHDYANKGSMAFPLVTRKSPFWFHVGSVSSTLTFASCCFCSLSMPKSLPPGTLTFCLNVKPKCLCSGIWPSVDDYKKEEMNTFPPWLAILGHICKINGLSTLLPHLPPSLFCKRPRHYVYFKTLVPIFLVC